MINMMPLMENAHKMASAAAALLLFASGSVAAPTTCGKPMTQSCMQTSPAIKSVATTDVAACCTSCIGNSECASYTVSFAQQKCFLLPSRKIFRVYFLHFHPS